MGSLITIEANHRTYIRPEYHEIMPIIPQSPLGSSRLPGDSPWHSQRLSHVPWLDSTSKERRNLETVHRFRQYHPVVSAYVQR